MSEVIADADMALVSTSSMEMIISPGKSSPFMGLPATTLCTTGPSIVVSMTMPSFPGGACTLMTFLLLATSDAAAVASGGTVGATAIGEAAVCDALEGAGLLAAATSSGVPTGALDVSFPSGSFSSSSDSQYDFGFVESAACFLDGCDAERVADVAGRLGPGGGRGWDG